MPTKKLTAAAVERLSPPERGRVEYFDSVLTGLSLRITDKGRLLVAKISEIRASA